MNEVRSAIDEVLKNDVILNAYIGRDSRNQPRVYESVAKKDEQAPFVVWTLLAGSEPEGIYGDLRNMEKLNVQVSAWGRTRNEAWIMYGAIQEALENGEWDIYLTPYSLMQLRRRGDQMLLEDPDTSWFQVPATYGIVVTR